MFFLKSEKNIKYVFSNTAEKAWHLRKTEAPLDVCRPKRYRLGLIDRGVRPWPWPRGQIFWPWP